MKIVVARYRENLDWLVPFAENAVVYNKGPKLSKNKFYTVVCPNVGREGHTYYKYIYDNYDHLDDYTVFLQGNPFDHSPNIIRVLKEMPEYIAHKTQNNIPIQQFIYLSEARITITMAGCVYHAGLPLHETYNRIFDPSAVDHSVCEIPMDKPFIFGSGAQFMVSRDAIRSRPREFYKNIMDILGQERNPIEGFVVERFHPFIFGCPIWGK